MKAFKNILLIWGVGVLISGGLTLFLVHLAYQMRGYWAIGGEYSPAILMVVICTWLTDSVRKKHMNDEQITLHPISKREP